MKRTLAVIGFSMLLALTLFSKTNNYNAASVTLAVSLALLFVSSVVKPLRQNMTIPTALLSVCTALCLFLAANAQYETISKIYNDTTVTVSGTLISLPTTNGSTRYYTVRTDEVNGAKEHINIRIASSSPVDLEPTDTLTAKLDTYVLGAEDDEFLEYYRSKNILIGGIFNGDDTQVVKGNNKSISSLILKVRYELYNEITNVLPNDYGAVVCGLVLGEKSALSERVSNAFRLCGVSHLFAVSGLHVSIWSSLIYGKLRKLGLGSKKSSMFSILFCLFFMLLTGANPPVIRAGFMMILVYAANIIQKEAEPINSIGFSLIVMLFQNPYCALSVSLWLSLLATLGILILYNGINDILKKPFEKIPSKAVKSAINYVISLIAVCVSVNIFTLPVYFFKFKSISLVLLEANLIMVFLGKLCMEIAGAGSVLSLIGLNFIGTPLITVSGAVAKVLIASALHLSSRRYLLMPVTSPLIITVFCISMVTLMFMTYVLKKKGKALRITALSLALVFVLCGTYVYAKSLITPEIIVRQSDGGISAVIKYRGYSAVVFADNEDYAASSVCDIMEDNAVSRIDVLALYESEKKARKLIESYNVGEILTDDPDLCDKVYYMGKLSNIERHTASLSSLTIATQNDFCHVIFNGKTTLICLDASALPEDYRCDSIICGEQYKDLINEENFSQTIYTKPDGEPIRVVLS